MKKRAIILDLDNTIYSAHSIGDKLFRELYSLLEINQSKFQGSLTDIKKDINKKPFSVVAEKYNMSTYLYQDALELLKKLTYNDPMECFADYDAVKKINCDKFLVTSGFPNLQYSKIKQLGIEGDFKGISIVDTISTDNTKKDVFESIQLCYNYDLSELLVVGDDPDSEIAAALALGMDAVLYAKNPLSVEAVSGVSVINSFENLYCFL